MDIATTGRPDGRVRSASRARRLGADREGTARPGDHPPTRDVGRIAPRGQERLADRLEAALERPQTSLPSLQGSDPVDDEDAALTLLRIHDLHLGPIGTVAVGVNLQYHPVLADLKRRLEAAFLERLESHDSGRSWDLPDDPLRAIRTIQGVDRVPWIYHWLSERASSAEMHIFLALEGGPDGGFDDLVALCQVGITGEAKVELARNYWDEMGRGNRSAVHTELHRTMTDGLGLTPVPRSEQPLACLERAVLGSTLATNRWLQPEMVGALGLIELQAGARCRLVVAALERVGASDEVLAFYDEHARVDPRHGKTWLDRVVAPLAAAHPDLAWRIVRGARWRSTVNSRFVDGVQSLLGLSADVPGLRDVNGDRTRPERRSRMTIGQPGAGL